MFVCRSLEKKNTHDFGRDLRDIAHETLLIARVYLQSNAALRASEGKAKDGDRRRSSEIPWYIFIIPLFIWDMLENVISSAVFAVESLTNEVEI